MLGNKVEYVLVIKIRSGHQCLLSQVVRSVVVSSSTWQGKPFYLWFVAIYAFPFTLSEIRTPKFFSSELLAKTLRTQYSEDSFSPK